VGSKRACFLGFDVEVAKRWWASRGRGEKKIV